MCQNNILSINFILLNRGGLPDLGQLQDALLVGTAAPLGAPVQVRAHVVLVLLVRDGGRRPQHRGCLELAPLGEQRPAPPIPVHQVADEEGHDEGDD